MPETATPTDAGNERLGDFLLLATEQLTDTFGDPAAGFLFCMMTGSPIDGLSDFAVVPNSKPFTGFVTPEVKLAVPGAQCKTDAERLDVYTDVLSNMRRIAQLFGTASPSRIAELVGNVWRIRKSMRSQAGAQFDTATTADNWTQRLIRRVKQEYSDLIALRPIGLQTPEAVVKDIESVYSSFKRVAAATDSRTRRMRRLETDAETVRADALRNALAVQRTEGQLLATQTNVIALQELHRQALAAKDEVIKGLEERLAKYESAPSQQPPPAPRAMPPPVIAKLPVGRPPMS